MTPPHEQSPHTSKVGVAAQEQRVTNRFRSIGEISFQMDLLMLGASLEAAGGKKAENNLAASMQNEALIGECTDDHPFRADRLRDVIDCLEPAREHATAVKAALDHLRSSR